MNALFLKDLADKTRRGLLGRVELGKSGGGLCYGYQVKRVTSCGEPTTTGDREIVPITASTTAFPRSVRGNACFLAGNACRLGCIPCLLAGDMRRLSRVPQLLSLLSDCFERLEIMISDLTRFLRESPELFRRQRGHARRRRGALQPGSEPRSHDGAAARPG